MPHVDFDAARRSYSVEREALTFDLGGERFTVTPDPSLGDTFDLLDAPEITPETEQQSVRVLARFIRRMLVDADRPRFDAALYRIPSTEATVVIDVAGWICEQVTTRPTVPPASSSRGRRTTGVSSTRPRNGKGRSS